MRSKHSRNRTVQCRLHEPAKSVTRTKSLLPCPFNLLSSHLCLKRTPASSRQWPLASPQTVIERLLLESTENRQTVYQAQSNIILITQMPQPVSATCRAWAVCVN